MLLYIYYKVPEKEGLLYIYYKVPEKEDAIIYILQSS